VYTETPFRPSAGALRASLPELSGAGRRLALRGLMLTLGRLAEVEGVERLGRVPGPAIFALNHNNAFESVLAPATLIFLRDGRLVHFLADWMYLHLPGVGRLLRAAEPIPVYRKPARWRLGEAYRLERRRKGSVIEACLSRLEAGGSLGIFPEGTRNADPRRLLRGRSGLGEIVLRSGAPVVPVGLHYPAAGRLGRMVLRVGEPLIFREEREAARGMDEQARMSLARRVVGRVMAELEELSGKTCQPQPFERRAA
jgi:1-acyl-sn-glycerol-3-phosphate acyltransferase